MIDAEGNAVAITQSLGDGFGSGVMAGETGLMLNNFGYWFDFDPASPNVIGPNRNIEMCMAPAAIFRDDKLFMVIGTPGSFGILQTTPQMISNVHRPWLFDAGGHRGATHQSHGRYRSSRSKPAFRSRYARV